jgi:esterase
MSLFYRKTGSGPPLIILHGLYGSSDNWTAIGRKLGESNTVFMIDLRNHGHSPHFESHTYNDMKNDLVLFFRHHHIDKATLLGHSMGGKTAMWFAADYPEHIEKLIIADIAPKNYFLLNEQSQYYLHYNILLAMIGVNFSIATKREDVADILSGKIDNEQIRSFLSKNLVRDRESQKLKWRINVRVLFDYLDEIVSGVNPNWFSDRIPILAYPITFIRGLKSNYILDEDKRLIRNIYPDSRIVDIHEAGHWLHAEKPDEFISAVLGLPGYI